MSDNKVESRGTGLEFEVELNEPPQKVWRAISMPEFRERWLPADALAAPEATTVTPDEAISYRLRDDTPPFLESTVTFTITPNAGGGTSLRIVHELDDVRHERMRKAAANGNGPPLMLAA
jgi:uncharacterized protein YndB with AHSA1/START domain